MCSLMKANITLKLDAALLREVRILAAEEGARRLVLCWQLVSKKSCANVKLMSGLASAPWLGSAKGLICSGRLLVRVTSSTNAECALNGIMSAKFFVDTNIPRILRNDRSAGLKHERARRLVDGPLVIRTRRIEHASPARTLY